MTVTMLQVLQVRTTATVTRRLALAEALLVRLHLQQPQLLLQSLDLALSLVRLLTLLPSIAGPWAFCGPSTAPQACRQSGSGRCGLTLRRKLLQKRRQPEEHQLAAQVQAQMRMGTNRCPWMLHTRIYMPIYTPCRHGPLPAPR